MEDLMYLLQANQNIPVPYRPNLVGQVERFQRTWKEMVSLYVNENHDDWDDWLTAVAYAYNNARNTTTTIAPNEVMKGRKLKMPMDLLRKQSVT